MKEKILEAFSDLGFKLEELDGMGYCFHYEGLNLLYSHNDDDAEFLNISLPGIIDMEGKSMTQVCTLVEKINCTQKYIKAYMLGDSVWLFYERCLIGEENLPEVISHMVLYLASGVMFARKTIEEIMQEETTNPYDGTEEHVEDTPTEDAMDDDDND